MAKYYNGHVSCVIPLIYKCSKCGAKSFATIPVSEDYSGTISLYGGSDETQIENARYNAACRLKTTVTEIYSKDPLCYIKMKHTVVGSCSVCGYKEVWQISQAKKSAQGILSVIISIFSVLACIIIPVILEKLFLIPVFMIGMLVLIYISDRIFNKISEKYPSNKSRNKQTQLDSIPQENRPVFACSLSELLDKIK